MFRIETADTHEELVEVMREKGDDEQVLVVNTSLTTAIEFIAAFIAAVVAVFDFDGTVTGHSQFAVARKYLMNDEMEAEDDADAKSYFRGGMTSDFGHISFIYRTVRRMLAARISREQFDKAVELIQPREGAIELMQTFMPRLAGAIAIISYGLWDVIRIWTDVYAYHVVRSDAIHALKLRWKRGMLSGWQPTTVVSDGNKGYRFIAHCAANGVEPEDAVVIGDSPITDLSMLREGIGILLIPDTEKELAKFDQEEAQMRADHRTGTTLARAFPHIQAVFLSDDLTPLAQIRRGEITA